MLAFGIGDLQLGEIPDETAVGNVPAIPGAIAIGGYSKPPTNFAIGPGAEIPEGREHSYVVALSPNRFRYPDSNINFGHHFEGNSDTRETLFYGLVEADGGFAIPNKLHLTTLNCCDACGYSIPEQPDDLKKSEKSIDLEVPGIKWSGNGFIGNLCFDCIRAVAMEYQAKRKFAENSANLQNPIQILTQQVSDLQKEVLELKEALQTIKKLSINSADCVIQHEYHGNHY